MTKIEAYKQYATNNTSSNHNDQAFLLLQKNEPCGVLFVDGSNISTCLDEHWEDCSNEPVWIMKDYTRKHYPYNIVWGAVSQKKFQRIQNGETSLIPTYTIGEQLI